MRNIIPTLLLGVLTIAGVRAEPTLHLIGDSTMADKVKEPANPETGWGQALPALLKPTAHVVNYAMNGRSTKSFIDEGRWAKVVAALQKYRPDLKMLALDAIPTGLIAVTNLDPRSTTLTDRYFDIVADFREQALADQGQLYVEGLKIADTGRYASHEALSSLFWL